MGEIEGMLDRVMKKLGVLGIPELGWHCEVHKWEDMVVNSVFNYKGYVLVQVKPTCYSSQQNRSVIEDLFYRGKRCRYLSIK